MSKSLNKLYYPAAKDPMNALAEHLRDHTQLGYESAAVRKALILKAKKEFLSWLEEEEQKTDEALKTSIEYDYVRVQVKLGESIVTVEGSDVVNISLGGKYKTNEELHSAMPEYVKRSDRIIYSLDKKALNDLDPSDELFKEVFTRSVQKTIKVKEK